jgi:hypothetical protein
MSKNKTYAMDELFKQSARHLPVFDEDNQVLTIDNFYENPEEIHDWLTSQQYPLWKYSTERDTENAQRYNDCRITNKVAHPTRLYFAEIERVLDQCRKYFHKGEYHWDMIQEFNVFQTIEEFDTKVQHYPHIDSELHMSNNASTLNMLVYLDKEESGGTAVYGGEWITNDEAHSLLYPVEERFTIDHIIPAKFNRCVIFPGNRLHGAYIDDYTKYSGEKWRFSQVQFFHPQRGQQ